MGGGRERAADLDPDLELSSRGRPPGCTVERVRGGSPAMLQRGHPEPSYNPRRWTLAAIGASTGAVSAGP